MLLLFPTKIALPSCTQGFMPKHGLFTPIGNTCDKGNNNLANSQKKMGKSCDFHLKCCRQESISLLLLIRHYEADGTTLTSTRHY